MLAARQGLAVSVLPVLLDSVVKHQVLELPSLHLAAAAAAIKLAGMEGQVAVVVVVPQPVARVMHRKGMMAVKGV